MGAMVEQVLTAFAQALPESAKEFDQANEIIKGAIAKGMSSQGLIQGGPPGKTGAAFPGGGATGSGGGAGI
jgi:hypothetical protein